MTQKEMIQETHDKIITLSAQLGPILKTFEPEGKFDKLVSVVKDNEGRSKVNKKIIWGIIATVSPVATYVIITALKNLLSN